MQVLGFKNEYRFLSNFWPSEVEFDGEVYLTVEHAYQAAKSNDVEYRRLIKDCSTPGQAKKLSKKLLKQSSIREDWDEYKLLVMLDLLRKKFKHSELRNLLIQTNGMELIEENSWNDVFWGVCKGVGENHLGKLLMQVREEI